MEKKMETVMSTLCNSTSCLIYFRFERFGGARNRLCVTNVKEMTALCISACQELTKEFREGVLT